MWLSDINNITNSNSESPSSWKIPLWIINLAKRFSLAVNSTFHFFMISLVNFMTLSDILYIWRSVLRYNIRCFIIVPFCSPWECVDQCIADLFQLFSCGILSVLRGTAHGLLALFTNPSARAGYDTRSIFKRSLTGLNSEFFLLLD